MKQLDIIDTDFSNLVISIPLTTTYDTDISSNFITNISYFDKIS